MAKRYGFTKAKDVKRANKAARLVLDRRVIRGAKFEGQVRNTGLPTPVIENGSGGCSCGTQYSRGSVVLTWSTVDVEFPTTYQTGWTDFPELAHIGSGVWESATATLDTCYGGIRSAKVQLTAIEPISMTAADFDGSVITFTAKIEVISVTNSCTGVDDDLANITAKFYCDNFNNLATSTFELVAYHNTGDYQFPCTVCVSPSPPSVIGECTPVVNIPATYYVSGDHVAPGDFEHFDLVAVIDSGTHVGNDDTGSGGVVLVATASCDPYTGDGGRVLLDLTRDLPGYGTKQMYSQKLQTGDVPVFDNTGDSNGFENIRISIV